MRKVGPAYIILILALLMSACVPALPGSSERQPVPSPGPSWNVQLTQSGGFVGVLLTVEVSSDGLLKAENRRAGTSVSQQLPPETISKLLQLYSEVKIPSGDQPQPTCADCFEYDLQLSSGGQTMKIRADDTSLASSGAGELISYLGQLRDQALTAKP